TGTTIAAVTTDFDGNARPQGSAYDIGAFEVVSAPPTKGTDLLKHQPADPLHLGPLRRHSDHLLSSLWIQFCRSRSARSLARMTSPLCSARAVGVSAVCFSHRNYFGASHSTTFSEIFCDRNPFCRAKFTRGAS